MTNFECGPRPEHNKKVSELEDGAVWIVVFVFFGLVVEYMLIYANNQTNKHFLDTFERVIQHFTSLL